MICCTDKCPCEIMTDDPSYGQIFSSNGICVSTFTFGCLPVPPNINVETQIALELDKSYDAT